MDHLKPPHTKQRKPGPRLEIPSGASPYASGPSSSSGDDAEGSSSASTSRSVHSSQKPKLSLFGVARTNHSNNAAGSSASGSGSSGSSSREELLVAPGFEHMSLEDKTMTPAYMQQQQQQRQQQQQSQMQSKPSSSLGGLKTKPKLALGSIARTPSPHLHAVSTSSAATSSASEGMSRSTSFEGALIAETSHASVDGDDYKLCPDALQDLGRLGEGASGEVRKVLHKPSGKVMAKKVKSGKCILTPSVAD